MGSELKQINMTWEQTSIESLKAWSQRLFWITILTPIVGALLGGAAGVIRYYVDRREKQLSAQATDAAIQRARDEANSARRDATTARNGLAVTQSTLLLAERAANSRRAYLELLELSREHSADADIARRRVEQIQTDLSAYELPLPFGESAILVKVQGKEVSTGTQQVSVKDLFANLQEPNITIERRRKLMAHLVTRLDTPDYRNTVLKEAHRLLTNSDNLPAMAATCGILHWLVRGDLSYGGRWVIDFDRWKLFAEQQLSTQSK